MSWKVDVGPLLRYDTTDEHNVYHGFALIVTESPAGTGDVSPPVLRFAANAQGQEAPKTMQSQGALFWTYKDESGNLHHFWRFKLEVQLESYAQVVTYDIRGACEATEFHVPGAQENFRWAAHSCNGFSDGAPEDEWNGSDPLWNDMLAEHAKQPFHMCMGGGDQIYCDKIAKEKEIQGKFSLDNKHVDHSPVTEPIAVAIDRYFFFNYKTWFTKPAFAKAAARIPMVNMLDDHDLIDGFGTYPDELMNSPVFNRIGSRGYFYYLLFQQFMNDEVDGVSNNDTSHPNPTIFRSMVIGGPGVYIPFPTHSLLVRMGPKQYMLLVDCRAQRKVEQICAPDTYQRCFDAVRNLPPGVEHLIVQLGVPLAYPRMVFLERFLSNPYNPVVRMLKWMMPGFTNNFNGQVELLDDLNDHWCAKPHKKERNWLVAETQKLALAKRLRITFISGDVHAGACGLFYSSRKAKPEADHRYSVALITSAITNAPPPAAVITLLNLLARKKHRTMMRQHTREISLPLFEYNLEGHKHHDKYVVGARNWCAASLDETDSLVMDLHVEKVKGGGETKVYTVKAPPPRYEQNEKRRR